MRQLLGGMLAALLAMPALRADDPPKKEPESPKAQYDALIKEFSTKQRSVITEVQKAKGDERAKLIEKYYAVGKEFAEKFYKLAEANPKDAVAKEALFWVIQNADGSPFQKKAADKLAPVVAEMPLKELSKHVFAMGSSSALLDAVLKRIEADIKDPDAADILVSLATIAVSSGNDVTGTKAAELLIEKFPDHRGIQQICSTLGRGRNPASSTKLLKTILEKSSKKQVKASAAMALAQLLANEADQQSDDQAKADKTALEAETYLKMVIDDLGKDDKAQLTSAEGLLKALRTLRVGKEAPEIKATDLDEKEFKLSDYRGKVVLLDFWGNW